MTQHFLALSQFSRQELESILALTGQLKEQQKQGMPHPLLQGRSVALIFEKSSTRTRVSFEVGVYQLGAQPLFISSATSQMGRGEPIKDTARTLARYCDGVMIRTYGQEIVEEFARYSAVPVINGLTDKFHPCQIMADLFTVMEHKGGVQDLTFAWVGDGNNMANTWIEAAALFGFELRLACPEGYQPDAGVLVWAREQGARLVLTTDPKVAVTGADVLNTDVWASMGQEAEQQERARAFAGYCLDEALVALARPDCLVLHCLPAHRGEEISEAVIEGPRSVVWDEAENRLHVQKAIMVRLLAPAAGR